MDRQIGEQIQRIRKAKGISQADLARASGLAQSFISSVESGQKSPTVRSLIKLAEALGVPPEKILELCRKQDERKSG
ncbi:MAG: helix-turn-helix transcriptional regulator [Firmicutes bacterium]|nr:helix-turn-helix transcriptional regulator [Bacillota bacterium]